MDQGHVTIRYKDRKAGRWITSRLEGFEFIRRYLQHVLPKGFHKVRYYGIWHKSNALHDFGFYNIRSAYSTIRK